MNRYLDDLIDTSKRMQKLATKIDNQKAQPLSTEEKELIRLAAAPRIRGMLDEVATMFIAGVDVRNTQILGDVSTMFEDLKD